MRLWPGHPAPRQPRASATLLDPTSAQKDQASPLGVLTTAQRSAIMDGIPDMSTDPAFHFPPDVFNAVVDAVPLLTRSRMDAVLFFKGCGVDRKILVSLSERVRTDSGFSKYHVTKEVLTFLNEQGDAGLGARQIGRASCRERAQICVL